MDNEKTNLKKSWAPPKVIFIPLPANTLNNLSGGGDGDSAGAHHS